MQPNIFFKVISCVGYRIGYLQSLIRPSAVVKGEFEGEEGGHFLEIRDLSNMAFLHRFLSRYTEVC